MNFTEFYFIEKKKKKKKRKSDVNVFPKKKFNQASFFNPKTYDKGVHGTFDFAPGMVGEKFETRPEKVAWRNWNGDLIADFTVDNQDFKFYGEESSVRGRDMYSISFDKTIGHKTFPSQTTQISPVKNSMKVFSAVLYLIKEFIQKKNPSEFYFTAENKDPSRVRLYKSFAKKVQEFLPDYELDEIYKSSLDTCYIFKKKD